MPVCYSPDFRSINKDSNSFRNSGAYTSPGTPDNNHFQKGWCSERVPLPRNCNRRRASANVLMNGKTLPSKWDDAERWITSPGFCKSSVAPPQRRPKSKSGPLGEFSNSNNFVMASSPFSTGVFVPNGLSFHAPDFQDELIDEKSVSRRDMATQMSPVESPNRRPPSPPPLQSPVERGRVEMRDVQVDKGITIKRHSKPKKRIKNEIKSLDLTWNPTQGATELSKHEKEEARIAAWENLQNAKAEASIRKLEMKLEKKKAASMERIMKKVRIAQIKAQEMRKTMVSGTGNGGKVDRKLSLISCFRC